MTLDVARFLDIEPVLAHANPVERAETIPSAWYWEERFHRLDSEAVLGTTWQAVGDVAQAAEAGAYFLAEVAGDPVIVVRGDDGHLRAFYNVCRHRGGPLATCAGRGKVLKCRYHGWTYRLDGSLRGVPHWDRVELFDKGDYGLIPLPLDVWEGLVFVALPPAPGPVATVVEGIAERIAPIRLADMTFAHEVVYDVGSNWKVYVDNYLEGYHVPHVHPDLFKLYDFQSYVTETLPTYSLQHSPLSNEDNLYTPDSGRGEAFYYWIWPNLMLNILPGRLQTNVVLPIGPDRCRVIFRYYYADTTSERARRLIREDADYADRVQQEDIEICERVQRGLGSRAFDRGRYSVKFEAGVYQFHELVRDAYRGWMTRQNGAGAQSPT